MKATKTVHGVILAGMLAALVMLPAFAEDCNDCPSKANPADSRYCECGWVAISVSNDAPVWWGNQGKAYGAYLEFAKAEIPEPLPDAGLPKFAPIYFDLDKSVLRPDGVKTAEQVLAYLTAHPKKVARIEGNCCDLAPNDYNMKLGMRRAEAVKKYLVEHGIAAERIQTTSFGEERRVTTDLKERPLNRRADVIAEKGAPDTAPELAEDE